MYTHWGHDAGISFLPESQKEHRQVVAVGLCCSAVTQSQGAHLRALLHLKQILTAQHNLLQLTPVTAVLCIFFFHPNITENDITALQRFENLGVTAELKYSIHLSVAQRCLSLSNAASYQRSRNPISFGSAMQAISPSAVANILEDLLQKNTAKSTMTFFSLLLVFSVSFYTFIHTHSHTQPVSTILSLRCLLDYLAWLTFKDAGVLGLGWWLSITSLSPNKRKVEQLSHSVRTISCI